MINEEKIKALTDAIDDYEFNGTWAAIKKARDDIRRPTPLKVPVLDAKRSEWWQSFVSRLAHSHDNWEKTLDGGWQELRTLTAKDPLGEKRPNWIFELVQDYFKDPNWDIGDVNTFWDELCCRIAQDRAMNDKTTI